jgi:hypothetical protein
MLPPTFAVFGGVMMLVLAITGRNDLSVADYSRIEEITSQRFARDRVAADIAVQGTLEFAQGADGIVTIGATLTLHAPAPDALVLQLQHVARSAADRRIVLELAAGQYSGVTTLATGRYSLELMPPDSSWRLAGTLYGIPSHVVLETIPEPKDGL